MTGELVAARVRRGADASLECVYPLRPGYAGFDGHFPGDVVLPGMCHVDLALRTVQLATGAPCALAAIVRARFTRRVRPGEELRVVVRRAPQRPDGRRWGALHFVGDERAAELTIDVTGAGEEATNPAE